MAGPTEVLQELESILSALEEGLQRMDLAMDLTAIARLERDRALPRAGYPELSADLRALARALLMYKRYLWNLREQVALRFDTLMQGYGLFAPHRKEYTFLRSTLFEGLVERESSYWVHSFDQNSILFERGRWRDGYLAEKPRSVPGGVQVIKELSDDFGPEVAAARKMAQGLKRAVSLMRAEVGALLESGKRSGGVRLFRGDLTMAVQRALKGVPEDRKGRSERWLHQGPPRRVKLRVVSRSAGHDGDSLESCEEEPGTDPDKPL